ncbi:hypothetical protein D3C71_1314120 [compost metagenome]
MVSNHHADFRNAFPNFLFDLRDNGVIRRFTFDINGQRVLPHFDPNDRIFNMSVYDLFDIVQAYFLPVLQLPTHPFDDGTKALLLHTIYHHRPKVPYNVIGNETNSWQHFANHGGKNKNTFIITKRT